MPLSPQMQYPWLPKKNFVDPDSMLGLDPRAMPKTPGYDPSLVRASDDVPGRKIDIGTPGGPGPGGGGGGIEPPPPPPPMPLPPGREQPPRGIPGQSHGQPPLRVPTMHQGTQSPLPTPPGPVPPATPPVIPSMHQHHVPVGDRGPVPSGRQGPGIPGMSMGGPVEPVPGGGGGGPIEPPIEPPTMSSGFGGGGPIGGGGGAIEPPPPPPPITVPTMSSGFGGTGSGGGGIEPPVPTSPTIPTPDLPPWVNGGGGGGGGTKTGPIDGEEKNPWSGGWWGGDEEEGSLMARGGIVTKPTRVTLGEQGPEMVKKVRPGRFEVGERPMTYLRRGGR